MKKVCVVGLGYIGLPTAIVAAQAGMEVVGIDVKENTVDCINRCCPLIKEPEIVEKLQEALETKQFYATTIYEAADYFVIAVPTPFTADKKADLSYVFAAATSIAGVLKKGDTVILESTVPVGTTRSLMQFLTARTGLIGGTDFFVAYCPERVLPGNIFHEIKINDRVIGGIDRGSTHHAASFYKSFVSGDLYLTTAETAEMVKLVENSYRDVNIAFAHQVASMAYAAQIDPYELIDLANKHPRVKILRPTCGVGGHCLAVDPYFLVEKFPQQTELLQAARKVNEDKPFEVLGRIAIKVAQWQESHPGKRCKVLVLGVTYKPDVDDLRESPALSIAKHLIKQSHIDVLVCEPYVTVPLLEKEVGKRVVNFQEGVDAADIILSLVAHTPFKALDKSIIAHKKIIDYCGLLYVSHKQVFSREHFFGAARNQHGEPLEKEKELWMSKDHAEKEGTP